MSDHHESFTLPYPISIVENACKLAASELRWSQEQDATGLILKEPTSHTKSTFFVTRFPATINLAAIAISADRTSVDIKASNFGYGPVQSNHVKQQALELRVMIENFARSSNEKMLAEMQTQIQEGVLCPTCRKPVPAGTKFCPNDGTPIARECPKCKQTNPPNAQFCTNCGAKI